MDNQMLVWLILFIHFLDSTERLVL